MSSLSYPGNCHFLLIDSHGYLGASRTRRYLDVYGCPEMTHLPAVTAPPFPVRGLFVTPVAFSSIKRDLRKLASDEP